MGYADKIWLIDWHVQIEYYTLNFHIISFLSWHEKQKPVSDMNSSFAFQT